MKFIVGILLSVITVVTLHASIDILDIQASEVGSNNGAIRLSLTGSAGPFDIRLTDESGAISHSVMDVRGLYGITDLKVGVYDLVVIDRFECETAFKITIEEACSIDFFVSDVRHLSSCTLSDCNPTGLIELDVRGGYFAPINWTGQTLFGGYTGTGERIDNLYPGEYTVEIRGANGCVVKETIEIVDCSRRAYPDIDVSLVEIDGDDDGSCNGYIQVDIVDFDATFYWTDGAGNYLGNDLFLTNLCEGEVELHVDNGCVEEVFSYEISNCSDSVDERLELSMEPIDICVGRELGSAKIVPLNGTPPYTYSWNNGESTQEITGLRAGIYTATVTDACSNSEFLSARIGYQS